MKKVNKLYRHFINDNRGETIVEVIVAFALLSIMLVLFSQGLAAASRSDMKAMETRAAADRAMLQLQKDKISKPKKTSPVDDVDHKMIYRQVYDVRDEQTGEVYIYVVYSTGN